MAIGISIAIASIISIIYGIIKKNKPLAILSIVVLINRERAIRSFIEYINKTNDDKCLDIPGKRQLTGEDAKKIIKDHCHIYNALDLYKFDVNKRNQYLKELKEGYGLSIRQIERLTGISRGIIQRA